MSILSEFKAFAVKGNVVDMAVGIIIGAAFGKIVSSLVADVIMPPVGVVVGGVDFTRLAVTLREAVGDEPAVVLRYGQFLQLVFDFLLVALAVFWLVKGLNRLKRQEEAQAAEPPPPSRQEQLLEEIRDALRQSAR
jgi:large conductance mechanosensitive channel